MQVDMDHLRPNRTHLKLTFKNFMLLWYCLYASGIAHFTVMHKMAFFEDVP